MRSRVKICGEQFDIDQVEGGKYRASSINLPGFELVAATHNLLRMRMQKALAEYDRAQLLKPAMDMASNGSPFKMLTVNPSPYPPTPTPAPMPAAYPQNFATGSGANVFVNDFGIQHAIPCCLTQRIGLLMAISEFGLSYERLSFRSSGVAPLIAELERVLAIAANRGATDIVWRKMPEITASNDLANPYEISARLHFLPQSVNAYIRWTPQGVLAAIV
jgi:hypothetical protein